MKRRIKRLKTVSRQTTGIVLVSALIVTAVVMKMIDFSVDARCSAVQKKIGACEKQLAAVNDELVREKLKWDQMKTPEKLADQLRRFGLEMSLSREEQLVRMDAVGKPFPGQLSVARVTRSKNKSTEVAKNARKR